MPTDSGLKDLLYRMADDALIIAHRNSEWTGLGPLLEEDIAFSSIAQDKLGHALALFQMLESLGEREPDTNAFTRNALDMRCCQLVEHPIGDYAFSLVRHFLFDTAEQIRYEILEHSSYEPLARLAAKVKGEIKYHTFHANTWMVQLGANGDTESRLRIQTALDTAYPLALGIFEKTKLEDEIIERGIFDGEDILMDRWKAAVNEVLEPARLHAPDFFSTEPVLGGRHGVHSEHLQPLLDEMTEVFRIDPGAEW